MEWTDQQTCILVPYEKYLGFNLARLAKYFFCRQMIVPATMNPVLRKIKPFL